MKPRKRLAFRPAIGVLIDQHQVAMSVTAATPRGRREVARLAPAAPWLATASPPVPATVRPVTVPDLPAAASRPR